MKGRSLAEILTAYRELGAGFLITQLSIDPSAQMRELTQQILQCRACGLHESKTHYVPGEGSLSPDILFVGEGPGETEDKFGRPFIGKAGQLLDRIIQKMGYRRDSVFIANVVKCRPPNNREPQRDEALACLPYLRRQVEILKPKAIVALGKIALNNLLDANHSISGARGKQFAFEGIPLIPTFHPSYILHKKDKKEASQAKWEIWEDMQKVLHLLGKEVVDSSEA